MPKTVRRQRGRRWGEIAAVLVVVLLDVLPVPASIGDAVRHVP